MPITRPNWKLLTIAGLLIFAGLAYSLTRQGHDFTKKQCTICHTGKTHFNRNNVKASITESCLTCHTNIFDEGYMHPVDIKAENVRVPMDFPLTASGQITCVTCHDVHASSLNRFGRKTGFLRRQEHGKTFCDICHRGTLGMANGHEPVFREAHFNSKYIVTSNSLGIDAMSKNCISCHDGSIGSVVELKAGSWRHRENFIKFDKGGMHPIGMNYEKARLENHKAALKPISMVDKRIRFFGNMNKVGCGSCHNPFSRKKNKLVLPNIGSKLCFACHNM